MEQLNAVIQYLEDHLLDEIDIDQVALATGMTSYHLKRTFLFFAGISIGEYLKKRRLSRANQELIAGASVTETAFKYGYQTVEGFSRAFKDYSGVAPSKIRQTQLQVHFPPLKFNLTIDGGITMKLRIIDKPAFRLVGVTAQVPIQFEGENNAIIELANSITEKQREVLHHLMDQEPRQIVNASYQFDEGRMQEEGSLTHLIGVITSKENDFADFETVAVPEATWAIFPSQGSFPQALQDTWGKIYSEWLPNSGYQLVEAPEISFTDFTGKPGDIYSEIWIAVTKK